MTGRQRSHIVRMKHDRKVIAHATQRYRHALVITLFAMVFFWFQRYIRDDSDRR